MFLKPLYSAWCREALIHDLASRHNQNTIKIVGVATGQTEEKDSSSSAEFTSPSNKGMVLSYTDRLDLFRYEETN